MSAGLSVLNRLNDDIYKKLENISSRIHDGISSNIKEKDIHIGRGEDKLPSQALI